MDYQNNILEKPQESKGLKIVRVISFLIGAFFIILFLWSGVDNYRSSLAPENYSDFPWYVYWFLNGYWLLLGVPFIILAFKKNLNLGDTKISRGGWIAIGFSLLMLLAVIIFFITN